MGRCGEESKPGEAVDRVIKGGEDWKINTAQSTMVWTESA